MNMIRYVTSALVFVAFATGIQSLRASPPNPPIGAVVQESRYDPAKGVATFSILNRSHKGITAVNLLVRVIRRDGTTITSGYGGDFLPYMVQAIDEGLPDNGVFAAGTVFAMDVPLGQQEVQVASASVDVVVYADDTADVLNKQIFESIISARTGRILGMQKANELLENALADPNDPHPSVTAVAQIKKLLEQYHANPQAGAAYEGLGLADAAMNIANAPKSPAGRTENEDSYLRKLIKTHQNRVSLFLPHTKLTKAVQP
jgi:hypothetical protein